MGDHHLKYIAHETLPDRILGMQRIENLFKRNGYLICQSTGKKIYNFNEVVVIFLPLSLTSDQVMAVRVFDTCP